MTFDEAKATLNALGLGINQAGTEASDTVPEGQIISSDPAQDEQVERNTTVNVVVSSGAEQVDDSHRSDRRGAGCGGRAADEA